MNFFGSRGYMGKETQAMIEVGDIVVADYLDQGALHPGLRVESVSYNFFFRFSIFSDYQKSDFKRTKIQNLL